MCPKICGNWVLLIYLKIPTSLLEDYNLDFFNNFLVCLNINDQRTIVITLALASLLMSMLSSSVDKNLNLLFTHTNIDSCYLNLLAAGKLYCLLTTCFQFCCQGGIVYQKYILFYTTIVMKIHIQTPHESRMYSLEFLVKRSRSQYIYYWKWNCSLLSLSMWLDLDLLPTLKNYTFCNGTIIQLGLLFILSHNHILYRVTVRWPTRESTDPQFCLRTVAAFPSSWVTRNRTNAAAPIGKADIGTICQSESSYSRGSVLTMTRRNMTSSGDCFDHVIKLPWWWREMQNQLF